MPPDARVPVGVQAVTERDGMRLMLLRGGTEWYADGHSTWAHPGGWLEFGEHPFDAAARETLEETSVVVTPQKFVGYTVNENIARSLWIVTLIIRCEYFSGEPLVVEPEKCPEVSWVPIENVDHMLLFAPTRAYQQKYAHAAV
jgi:8-oxo-dGTP diphosphatase